MQTFKKLIPVYRKFWYIIISEKVDRTNIPILYSIPVFSVHQYTEQP